EAPQVGSDESLAIADGAIEEIAEGVGGVGGNQEAALAAIGEAETQGAGGRRLPHAALPADEEDPLAAEPQTPVSSSGIRQAATSPFPCGCANRGTARRAPAGARAYRSWPGWERPSSRRRR